MFKKTLLATAVALTLPVVAFADIEYDVTEAEVDKSKPYREVVWVKESLAETQENLSAIKQTGDANIANVYQTAGGTAKSTVIQDGDSNTATVSQDATNPVSDIYQGGVGDGIGTDNTAVVAMGDGDSYSRVEQFGADNYANVGVWGAMNNVYVTQYEEGLGHDAWVTVYGTNNVVDSVQVGKDNFVEAFVWGDDNTIDNDQGGWNNDAYLTADGWNNKVTNNQWGDNNIVVSTAIGTDNVVRTQQLAWGATITSTVNGLSNDVWIDQFRATGSDVVSYVEGDDNDLTLSQEKSTDDLTDVLIIGSNLNYVGVQQGKLDDPSNDNKAYVTIYGGSGNSAVVKQFGDNNYAHAYLDNATNSVKKIKQSGSGNQAYSYIQ